MKPQPHISFVIPVFNGATSIQRVVDEIQNAFKEHTIEIILVNDHSLDSSELVCRKLFEEKKISCFIHMAKNFGEHPAVLAGLRQCTGNFIAILDDDGQNPPSEILKMLHYIENNNLDVVYGRYEEKKHSIFRNFGSWINDKVANIVLKKPKELYLSSFKIMNQFLKDEVVQYSGPYAYIDGLILRSTSKIGQCLVKHKANEEKRSNYTIKKLLKLWSNMFLSFSILPLRLAALSGLLLSFLSALVMIFMVIDKIWINPNVTNGIPTLICALSFFSGMQLLMLGTLGEYLGRLYLDQNKTPQSVPRYILKH